MKKRNVSLLMIAFIATTVVAFGATAFAGWGMGDESRGWGHRGQGWHHRGADSWQSDLTDEDIEKLEMGREAFLKDTDDLRLELHSKALELRSVLVKPEPDQKNALAIQKEISKLRAQLDEKHIKHMIEMKRINPNVGRRLAEGAGRGFGPGRHGSYGKGRGSGACGR
jgi:Spy/CpxP family protein refolding chaperone